MQFLKPASYCSTVIILAFALSSGAQAPANAPAGSTAICKDGTFSTDISKAGACHGHKGIQTWYALQSPSTAAMMPTPTPVPSVAAVAAPTQAQTISSVPAPIPATRPDIATERVRLLAGPPAPGGGPGLVWLNGTGKVYHCPGTDFYGKTKTGSYVSEADARAKGARPSRNKPCS